MSHRAISIVSALALAATLPLVVPPAQGRSPGKPPVTASAAPGADPSDNRPHPLATRRSNLRQVAVDQLASNDARLVGKGTGRAIALSDGTKVDYPATQSAQLLSFLVDFGGEGPQHGQIPEPAPSDNSTYWKADFSRQHYLDMFFNGMPEQGGESFKDFYREMSSGRFQLSGDVSDWVSVERPESYYGANLVGGVEDPERMAEFIQDSADSWFTAQLAGRTDAQVKAYLAQYDVWDRYDADGDGNYNEPDGYIDHFQAIHAGAGEEAGADASTIWSHRSGASYWTDSGPDPSSGCACAHQGGVEIGDSGYYILDYTTEPEDGGLGIFAHEFGHDLGLPDYYDTTGGDNGTGFWTLMSSGSWLGHGDGTVGTTPGQMGATEKYFLGWYGARQPDGSYDDLAVTDGLSGEAQTVTLGPSYRATTRGAQAVLVNLPDGSRTLSGPFAGSDDGGYLYSGTRDAAIVGASGPSGTAVSVPEDDPTLTARVAYQIEPGFDYAFLRASTDGGEHWADVPTDLSVAPDSPDPQGFDLGITGVSGAAEPVGEDWPELPVQWVTLRGDLTEYAGQSVQLRWEYYTDGRTHGDGFAVDQVHVGSYSTSYSSAADWDLDGFHAVTGNQYTVIYPQYYIAENRQYRGYDRTLQTGPYSADYESSAPGRVDQFPYQDGLLIWYANGFYGDNNTASHPGGGANLPVDAEPHLQVWHQGVEARGIGDGRLQAYDATFDVDRTDPLALTREVEADGTAETLTVPARQSVPVFEDAWPDAYLDKSAPSWFSTEVAGTGTEIQVLSSDETTGTMRVKIGKRFVAATGPVSIAGGHTFGDTITATPPTWFQDAVDTQVGWLRDGAPIGTDNRPEHTITAADVGHTISASFTGVKRGYAPTTLTTSGIAVTALPAPQPTKAPGITGTARVGRTLAAVGARWPVQGSSTYVWSVGGTTVGTGTSYTLRPADAGKKVTLTETLSSPGYLPGTASARSARVAKARVSLKVTTGKARKGEKVAVVIRTTAGSLTVPGTVAIRYAGKRLSPATLKGGAAVVRLPAKRKGSYPLTVTYLGATGFGPATRTVTVRVR